MPPKRAAALHLPRTKTILSGTKKATPPPAPAPQGPATAIPAAPLPTNSQAKPMFDMPTDTKAAIRKDYFTETYVIVAPKRNLRPSDFTSNTHQLFETASSPRLDLQAQVDAILDRNGNWKTKVVDNKFPALTLDNPQAYGKQEIVLDTPLANTPLGRVGVAQLTTVLQTYQKRTVALSKLRGIKYVSVFKNDGVRAGASLAHSHSQIIAAPLIPPRVSRISIAIEEYFQKNNKDPYDTVIEFERSEHLRVIGENTNFIAFCPFASRWPLDVWIVPLQKRSNIVEFNEAELGSLAEILQKVIGRLSNASIDYNFYLENGISPNHRFALKVQARSLNWFAGFEMATEITVNPIPPEVAASWYRSNS